MELVEPQITTVGSLTIGRGASIAEYDRVDGGADDAGRSE
jgi:hypothetical protein